MAAAMDPDLTNTKRHAVSVELQKEVGGKILFLNLIGKLGREDYAHFIPEVERAVKTHGKVRLLVRMHGFHGWTMRAVWEDLKFDLRNFSHIERFALIGDKRWESEMALLCKPLTTSKERYFDESKTDQATAWIHEGYGRARG